MIVPVVVIRAMRFPAFSVNQSAPSAPAAMPVGALEGVAPAAPPAAASSDPEVTAEQRATAAAGVVLARNEGALLPLDRTALRRVEDHCLPLESDRAMKVYGQPSAINRLLILNAEPEPGRGIVLLLREAVGF